MFLLCLFILLLYEGLNQILEITDEDQQKKRNEIFKEKLKEATGSLNSLYNEEMKAMPESQKIKYFLMKIKVETNKIINSSSSYSEFEKQYYLNNLLNSLNIQCKISPEYILNFLRGYLNILDEYQIELLLKRKEAFDYYYPVLNGLTSIHKEIKNSEYEKDIFQKYINELYNFLKKQNYIESPILIQFVLNNPNLFLNEDSQQLKCFIDLIRDLDSFSIEELEYQLFKLGDKKDTVEPNVSKLICEIWNYLFELYDEGSIILTFVVEEIFQFMNFFGEISEFAYKDNLYSISLKKYIDENPRSTILTGDLLFNKEIKD